MPRPPSAASILRKIKKQVVEKTGVKLEEEIKIIGI